jgi:hypothetical protein
MNTFKLTSLGATTRQASPEETSKKIPISTQIKDGRFSGLFPGWGG